MDLVLSGRPVPADEAYTMGLVNRLVPPGRARAAGEGRHGTTPPGGVNPPTASATG